MTKSFVSPSCDDIILDVGCGDGYQIGYMAGEVDFAVGVDLSLKGLTIAKRKAISCEFVRADCNSLPFRNGTFSKIMCLEVLEHLEQTEKSVYEIGRCLKEGGSLVVSVPYREPGTSAVRYGHLHVFDEDKILGLMPKKYELLRHEHFLNTPFGHPIFRFLPFRIWRALNKIGWRKGY